jgi:hypothetical protein
LFLGQDVQVHAQEGEEWKECKPKKLIANHRTDRLRREIRGGNQGGLERIIIRLGYLCHSR